MTEHDSTAVDGLDTTVAEDTVATGPAVEDNTTTASDTSELGQHDTSEPGDPEGEPEAGEPQSRREARYRRQLRDVEAERDRLAAQLAALQRAEVERMISDRLDRPDAIWALGLDLDAVTDPDTGAPIPDKLYATVDRLKAEFGIIGPADRKKRNLVVPNEGTSIDGGDHGSNTWKNAFRVL